MGKLRLMPAITLLAPHEWLRLRDVRLSALRESPDAFLSTYEQEKRYNEKQWRAEFIRGDWNIGLVQERPVSLLGVTHEVDAPAGEFYIEYLWVAPECRRSGIARTMLTDVLSRQRNAGTRTVFLWVLDGNELAMHLYKTVGFSSTNHRQPLRAQPGRCEERMRLDLI